MTVPKKQPHIQLYVQDFLTDEKLMECSALATGVCIKILCVMHKSDEYGKILLKPKDKREDSEIHNFAQKLSKHFPWDMDTTVQGLTELLEEGVMHIDGDYLIQKRMIRDYKLRIERAKAGKKGGKAKRIPQNGGGSND